MPLMHTTRVCCRAVFCDAIGKLRPGAAIAPQPQRLGPHFSQPFLYMGINLFPSEHTLVHFYQNLERFLLFSSQTERKLIRCLFLQLYLFIRSLQALLHNHLKVHVLQGNNARHPIKNGKNGKQISDISI